ncbi:ABC transporter ATP-binding protein [Faecalibaculum rodentium]|uniref:ABC-type antimicrobial peptide transport system ATPase component n=2 Tax=Faecalibaculum rodentium TaxID=1702221 RepID=A0A140DYZ3_9FIRM|nr:ABC transporter ATP-binding protein [Faecalibaculum rodentium]AMK55870.1 aBC-type antimicrobial peptide transport system ATPase component [Faecalibaculum rodentium]
MEEYAVKICDIHKTWNMKTTPVNALQGCSFKVEPGEFVTIIGRSGSGKSTLLHCIAGLIAPEEGTVEIGKTILTEMNEEQRSDFRLSHIGLVFQFYSLVQELTVEENLRLPFEVNGSSPDKEFLEELKSRLDIKKLENKYPRECSGGQQQRIAIARALSVKPDLILADEPTGNLDSENSRKVFSLFRECQRMFNQTVIMVTHDLALAKQADRMLVMEDGRIQNEQI